MLNLIGPLNLNAVSIIQRVINKEELTIKEILEGWEKGELSGDAAMCVIHDVLYPAVITQEDIDWANLGRNNNVMG